MPFREQQTLVPQSEEASVIFLTSILDSVHDGIVAIDKEGTIIYANPAYTRILGVKKEQVLGKKMVNVAPEALVLKALHEKTTFIDQPSRVISLGIDVKVSSFPIWDQGEVIGAVSVFRDVSEVSKLKEELERTRGWVEYFKQELKRKEALPLEFKSLVGKSNPFRETLFLASKVAKTDTSVLIRGETGVGKEVLAEAIHNASKRRNKPLIRVNCAAIPETLLESELFGYEEGAFTGARRKGKPGKFELADGGTLFLDEVGDMGLEAQAKLLRAIQNKEIERLGGMRPISVDVRIIAATNQDLEAKIRERVFREDLFYRLNVFPLTIPPLRERKEDILPLAAHFLEKFSQQYGKSLVFSDRVAQLLLNYTWPGNIRELQNAVEHAVIAAEGFTITLDDLPNYLKSIQTEIKQPLERTKHLEEGKQMEFFASNAGLSFLLSQVEKSAIEEALKKAGNNKSEAIRMLGISRSAFYEKLKRYFGSCTESE